jgi:hypothetical protein
MAICPRDALKTPVTHGPCITAGRWKVRRCSGPIWTARSANVLAETREQNSRGYVVMMSGQDTRSDVVKPEDVMSQNAPEEPDLLFFRPGTMKQGTVTIAEAPGSKKGGTPPYPSCGAGRRKIGFERD